MKDLGMLKKKLLTSLQSNFGHLVDACGKLWQCLLCIWVFKIRSEIGDAIVKTSV